MIRLFDIVVLCLYFVSLKSKECATAGLLAPSKSLSCILPVKRCLSLTTALKLQIPSFAACRNFMDPRNMTVLRSIPNQSLMRFDEGGDASLSNQKLSQGNGLPSSVYRPFAEYAWSKFLSSNLITPTAENSNMEQIINYSQSRKEDCSTVRIEINSISSSSNATATQFQAGADDSSSVVRLVRYALLETLPTSSSHCDSATRYTFKFGNDESMKTHATNVLNFIIFPNPLLCYQKIPNKGISLPILGIDLVTLPGGKHLCVIDFQPVLPQNNYTEYIRSWPERYRPYEERISFLHRTLVKDNPNLPWGGDIPEAAARFFSPYALWTRLRSETGLNIIKEDIFTAFCAYVDLYIELLLHVKKDLTVPDDLEIDCTAISSVNSFEVIRGHSDYLKYRQANDPARPMLRKLYGDIWTENILQNKLFPML